MLDFDCFGTYTGRDLLDMCWGSTCKPSLLKHWTKEEYQHLQEEFQGNHPIVFLWVRFSLELHFSRPFDDLIFVLVLENLGIVSPYPDNCEVSYTTSFNTITNQLIYPETTQTTQCSSNRGPMAFFSSGINIGVNLISEDHKLPPCWITFLLWVLHIDEYPQLWHWWRQRKQFYKGIFMYARGYIQNAYYFPSWWRQDKFIVPHGNGTNAVFITRFLYVKNIEQTSANIWLIIWEVWANKFFMMLW